MTIKLWDSHLEDRSVNGHSNYVVCVAFNHDGSKIVSASHDGCVMVWDSITGLDLLKIDAHLGYVWTAAFHPDGSVRLLSH